jgi:hypothetical protein
LFALNDQNFNLSYEPGEEIAFPDTPIEIKDTTGIYLLTMFKPAAEKQKVLATSSPQPGKVIISLAKPAENMVVTLLTGSAGNGVEQFQSQKGHVLFLGK